ncbi:pyridoxine/pyridoxamine 5'-phosphate oxidase [Sphingobacterium mizutaii NBRC 14946 = DSM 11724]|uniref:Pyridoxine/pyridoxamine 5'-phosphate oxidase n=2 Tax=Sphingobacterium mizutaii TaxID=1010 RepID=A0AAJ4XER1_9SPHI|nr:pyridoxamine 5'-phosphate oxidase [Sphingobacterium mizutaii]GEM70210.1 pyridoxine/pyridoxamine 5'-phosphate oxidase [Sphingobacterium mizutaii NBRC 14946 = DSM 11724]SDL24742.1 Pyridoxamine 5'-phosphate oxidase [Sphingobacterium mizutaii]SNV53085.1 Pyridoxine/pyridoxamine 5'-phosphate oxidase [Sphingobacterium mizutaii]
MSIEHKEIAAIREDYVKSSLSESDVQKNPIEQFQKWFDEAMSSQVTEPTAMVLSTVAENGCPSSRVVLLKDIKAEGLSFFTNYNSRKGQEIIQNPRVSALFFWPELQRQVRFEAEVEKLPKADSDEYFSIRPRGSQIGAIASPQSAIIPDRETLEKRVAEVEKEMENVTEVPRPEFWGGFLLKPVRVEFWQGRGSRLHDRIVYIKDHADWTINRLAP